MQKFKFYNVPSFKKIDDPILPNIKRYFMLVNILNFFDNDLNDWKQTNPREQNDISKKLYNTIYESIKDEPKLFHIKNKGILFSVKKCTYDNKDQSVELEFDDSTIHGNIDGGHTMAIIQKLIYNDLFPQLLESKALNASSYNICETNIEKSNFIKNIISKSDFYRHTTEWNDCYVMVEIFENIELSSFLCQIISSRNSSLQVDDKSINNLEKKYDGIKKIIYNPPKELMEWNLQNRISEKQGQNKEHKIDIVELSALIQYFKDINLPTSASIYNGWRKYGDDFINEFNNMNVEEKNNEIENSMYKLLWKILELYDLIETSLPIINTEKKYGRKPYSKFNGEKEVGKSKYGLKSLKYIVPDSIVKPLISAFKHLVVYENGEYFFKKDPIEIWSNYDNQIAIELIQCVLYYSEDYHKNNCNSLGKDNNLYIALSNIVKKKYN